jgi:hypothetical protein
LIDSDYSINLEISKNPENPNELNPDLFERPESNISQLLFKLIDYLLKMRFKNNIQS